MSDETTTRDAERADAGKVLDRLLRAHEGYFDVERDHEHGGRTFPGYAEFHSMSSQYVLSKRAKLWEANSHEYMFFVVVERLDEQAFDELVAFMTSSALDKVTLEDNHMSSYLTLVVIASAVDDGLDRIVRKTSFRKSFMLGLKGWADLRVCVIDLDARRVHSNARGRDIVPTLEANAFGLD